MRAILPLFLVTLLAACGGGEEPVTDPAMTMEGRKCGQAHGSWMDSLTDMYTQAGAPMPDDMPTKEAYIEKCYAMGFTEEQAKCLDPKRRGLMKEDCEAAHEHVKDKVEELDNMFTDVMKAAQDEAKEGAEGEGAEGEGAEGEGAEGEGAPTEAPAEGEATE